MKRNIRAGLGGLLLLLLVMAAHSYYSAHESAWLERRASRAQAQVQSISRLQAEVAAYIGPVSDGGPERLRAAAHTLENLRQATDEEQSFLLDDDAHDEAGDDEVEGEHAAELEALFASQPPPDDPRWSEAMALLADWHEDELGEVREAELVVRAHARRTQLVAGVTSLAAVLLAAVLVLVWLPRLSRRLDRVTATVRALGQGDASARLRDAAPDELGELARAFDEMADDRDRLTVSRAELKEAVRLAQEADRTKSRFLANMSHEIRTPMNAVMGMLDLAIGMAAAGEVRDCMVTAKDASCALLDVINDILDFSRIEAGRLEIVPQDFDLEELTSTLARTLGPLAHQKGLEFLRDAAADVPRSIRADPGRLRQILVNLLGNAIKFTDEGEVSLKVSVVSGTQDDLRLRFVVRDTGKGIPEDQAAGIFDPFKQVAGSHGATTGGTGLGLSISRQLARAMGGDIVLSSQLGEGTSFTLELPCERGADVDASSLEAAAAALAGLPVLIVDDNATNRKIVEDLVRRWNMVPVVAEDGAAAITLIDRSKSHGVRYALVLLDWVMPDTGGLEVARHIRKDPGLRTMPIVVLSSGASPLAEAKAEGIDLDGYLRKPLDERALLTAIAGALQVIAPPKESAPSNSTAGALEGLRVLVAEDNPINQILARKLLDRAGCEVVIAVNGEEAVAQFRSRPFDVVLMDLQMPKLDGLGATAAIRRLEQGTDRHTPVLAVTAYAMKSDRERCMDGGMDGFISKPVAIPELLAAIRRLDDEAKALPCDGVVLPHPELSMDLQVELLEAFLEGLPEQLSTLRTQIEARDPEPLARTVHQLKGALLALGECTDTMAASASLLQRRLRSGKPSEVTWTLAEDLAEQLEEFEADQQNAAA